MREKTFRELLERKIKEIYKNFDGDRVYVKLCVKERGRETEVEGRRQREREGSCHAWP